MNFGEKLFELRKEKKLSQEEVADRLNVTRQTVSKWETNQSTPDFDKIIPLCELFEISTEELLTGKKPEENNTNQNKNQEPRQIEEQQKEQVEKQLTRAELRRKSAEVVSTSVFIYILAVAILMVAIPVLRINPIIVTAVFLCIVAWATARIIKHYMSVPKIEKTEEEKRANVITKQINSIVGTICTIVYFIVSFITGAWHITWVIFIIDGLICEIIKLISMLNKKGENANEE